MTNPLLADWPAPYGLPPFGQVRAEHFEPAFERAMREHMAEIEAIAGQTVPPTFRNTVQAFDRSGRLLTRIKLLFHNLTVSETSPQLQAVELMMAPRLAAHDNAIYLHAGLFDRINALHQLRDMLRLEAEDCRLLERLHLDFVLAGAQLAPAARKRLREITEELAVLSTRFSQNLLAEEAGWLLPLQAEEAGWLLPLDAEEAGWLLPLDAGVMAAGPPPNEASADAGKAGAGNPSDLAGLPDSVRAATWAAAQERGLGEHAHAVTLSRSLVEPFLTFAARRDLREAVWRAWVERGAHPGAHDNRPVAARVVALRQELAALHGYASYADYALADRMAPDPAAVLELLRQTWEPAKAKARQDRRQLSAEAQRLGEPTPIAAWDWRYLAEKVRQRQFDLDDALVKPYFTLDNMIAAMFDCAGRLFGLQFVEQTGLGLYHPDVRLWEVRRRDGALAGIFLGDNFARPTKRGGAWMSVFRDQSAIDGGTLPIVVNNNNFAKANPTLLSLDDVRTLFHEFGHGLHGLLSQVKHERLAGTRVLRDFVELPSQLFENWALAPQILQQHARHWQTGEAIPAPLVDKLLRSRRFDQPWASLQYTACALIDMALHGLPNGTPVDIAQFEAEQAQALGVDQDIGQRHYLAHFQHLSAMQLRTMFTCGPRCSRQMRSKPSSRPAISSTGRPRSGCWCTSIAQAARWSQPRPIARSVDAMRWPSRCCASAAWPAEPAARRAGDPLSQSRWVSAAPNRLAAQALPIRSCRRGRPAPSRSSS